jgi:hypothetical protein
MLSTFPPAYLYEQYRCDENLQAIFGAYNNYVAAYLLALNSLNLPIYPNLPSGSTVLTVQQDGTYGSLVNDSVAYDLDGPFSVGANTIVGLIQWVLTGLYGIPQPTLGALISQTSTACEFNTFQFNRRQFNQFSLTKTYNYSPANLDLYRRVATWLLYKGDGLIFGGRWLKRRVVRFLTGVNGADPGVQQTYGVSVVFAANYEITITITSAKFPGAPITALSELLASGALGLPIPYSASVVTV